MAHRRHVLLIGVLATLCTRLASSEEDPVRVLTGAKFDEAIKGSPLVLVEFFAPWCGHCKSLEPEYRKAAEDAANKAVIFAKVDATKETELSEKYKVEGFPTILFFRNGQPETYTGGRNAAEITQWLKENTGPALYIATSEEDLKERLKGPRHKAHVVAIGSVELRATIEAAAEKSRRFGSFVYLQSASPNSIAIHRGHEETVTFGGDHTSPAAITAFVKKERVPFFGQVDEDNFELVLEHATEGMFWVCFSPESFEANADATAKIFQEVSRKWEKYPFVWLDTKEYDEHAKEELGCNSFPSIVFQQGNLNDESSDNLKTFKKVFKTIEEISANVVSQWMDDVHNGKVEPEDDLDDLDDEDDGGDDLDEEL